MKSALIAVLLIPTLAFACGQKKSPEDTGAKAGWSWHTGEGGMEYAMYNGSKIQCAVQGDPANPSESHWARRDLFSDYNGKRYFFCCPGCPDQFKADPESFIKKGAVGVPVNELTDFDRSLGK